MQDTSRKLLLKLRIPSWLDEARGASVVVNGEAWAGCQVAAGHMAGSFCSIERTFTAGAPSPCNLLSVPRIQYSKLDCAPEAEVTRSREVPRQHRLSVQATASSWCCQ